MSISSISQVGPGIDLEKLASVAEEGGQADGGFMKTLERQIAGVNELLVNADKAGTEVALGRSENLHEAMISLEKAETSLKFLMQVRNKAIDAYNEILRMQV